MTGRGSGKASKAGKKLASRKTSKPAKRQAGKDLKKHQDEAH